MKRAAILLPSILLASSVVLLPAARSAGILLVDPIAPMPAPVSIPRPHVIVTPFRPGIPTPSPVPPMLHGSVSYGLRLQSANIKVEVADNVAKTFVSQTFANDSDQNVAGTYLFPLPKDTTFSSFSLMIDGKPVEGKILEANEARAEYEDIVRRMVDPGLLEYADYKTVRARIYPIPAHGTKKVELEYTQLLQAENGMLKYNFPLKTQGAEPSDELKITVNMKSSQGLRTIWSPSHIIATTRDGDHRAKVQFIAHNALADKDFCLYYSLSDKDVAANVVTNKFGSGNEDGYYLLTLTPPVQAKAVAQKDVVLVIDTSGSMEGPRLQESKEGLKYIIKALNPQDRFSLVAFNTDVEPFKSQLVPATADNKEAAVRFVEELEASGGTDIGDALKSALSVLDTADSGNRPGFLVLATDGEPTVGETTIPGLLKTVHSKRDVRLFDFGVGYDVNTRLLDRLAEEHHGTSQYVEPSENFETAMSDFYNKIQKPVLTDVKIAYDGIQVKDVYPRDVKDIFAGSQVLLLGKYRGSGDATVKLTGTINGVQKAYTFPVKFAAQELDNSYLPRMWAMRRIAHLTDVAQDNGDTKEVVDEIVALSKKYGLISAYTSFLVTDPNERNAHGMPIGAWAGGFHGPVRGVAAPAPLVRAGGAGGGAGIGGGIGRHTAIAAFYSAPRNIQIIDERPVVNNFREAPTAQMPSPSAGANARMYFAPNVFGGAGGSPAFNALSAAPSVGRQAVMHAKALNYMKDSLLAETDGDRSSVKNVDDKTFYLRDGVWVDSSFDEKSSAKPIEIAFGSRQYFDLLKTPGISKYLAVGKQVLFVFAGKTYKVTAVNS